MPHPGPFRPTDLLPVDKNLIRTESIMDQTGHEPTRL